MACLSAKSITRVSVLGAVIILLGLSASNFEYANSLGYQKYRGLSAWNVLRSDRAADIHELQARLKESEVALGFMVWPRERKKIQMEMLSTLRKLQNLSPYRAGGWQTLLAIGSAEDTPLSEKFWLLEHAIRLNKWREKHRPSLAYYCIHHLADFSDELRHECLRLIAALPLKDNRPHLAKVIGVEPAQLDRALHQAGVF